MDNADLGGLFDKPAIKVQPWTVIEQIKRLVAMHPHLEIGKLELWDTEGVTMYKSLKSRKLWLKKQQKP